MPPVQIPVGYRYYTVPGDLLLARSSLDFKMLTSFGVRVVLACVITVLAVLLFLASGLRGTSGGTSRRNLDQESVEIDVDSAAGMDAG